MSAIQLEAVKHLDIIWNAWKKRLCHKEPSVSPHCTQWHLITILCAANSPQRQITAFFLIVLNWMITLLYHSQVMVQELHQNYFPETEFLTFRNSFILLEPPSVSSQWQTSEEILLGGRIMAHLTIEMQENSLLFMLMTGISFINTMHVQNCDLCFQFTKTENSIRSSVFFLLSFQYLVFI